MRLDFQVNLITALYVMSFKIFENLKLIFIINMNNKLQQHSYMVYLSVLYEKYTWC